MSQLYTGKLEKIPVLKKLRALEEQAGKDVTLGAEPVAQAVGPKRQSRRQQGDPQQDAGADPQKAAAVRRQSRGDGRGGNGGDASERRKGRAAGGAKESGGEVTNSVTTVYLGGIPAGLRVSELKSAL